MAIEPLSLGVPKPIIDSLPEADGTAAQDMQRAVEGLETRLNRAIEDADTESEAAGYVVDALERLEGHYERYDEFIPELRAWGSRPSTPSRGGTSKRTSSSKSRSTTG